MKIIFHPLFPEHGYNLKCIPSFQIQILVFFIEISQLFSQINRIEPDLELDIHHILKKMIKEHFKDDENKCRELLTMISKSIFKKNLEGLTYKEKTEIRMNDLNQQIEQQEHQLEQKDQQIEQKDEENKKLKKEIEQLKQQISNQE